MQLEQEVFRHVHVYIPPPKAVREFGQTYDVPERARTGESVETKRERLLLIRFPVIGLELPFNFFIITQTTKGRRGGNRSAQIRKRFGLTYHKQSTQSQIQMFVENKHIASY